MGRTMWLVFTAAALLALAATTVMAQVKGAPARDAAPALTAEQQAVITEAKDLHKQIQIAQLELRLAELKGAPEKDIAAKAEDVYRLRGTLHALIAKHPEIAPAVRGQGRRGGRGGGIGGGRGMGRMGRGGGMGRGPGMGRGGGMGRGMDQAWDGGRGMGRGWRGGGPGAGQGQGLQSRDRQRLRIHQPDLQNDVAPSPAPEPVAPPAEEPGS